MNNRECQPAPPSIQAQAELRGALSAVAQWFAFPIAAVVVLLGGALLLQGPSAERVVLWLASLAGALAVVLLGIEAVLAYRLRRFGRAEIGAYDYDWIQRAQGEQPKVGALAKQCLVERGAVTVAELARMWRLYVAEQNRTVEIRRRAARRRCAESLGLRPKGSPASAPTARAGRGDSVGRTAS